MTSQEVSQYSPISTLESQYAQPLGQRWAFFVQIPNANLVGGVETILKHKGPKPSVMTSSNNHQQPPAQMDNGQYNDDTTTSASSTNHGDDPFDFLQQEETTTAVQKGSKPKKLGRLIQKVAHSTTSRLERGMHGLAIKADQGRTPDWVAMGLYVNHQLQSMTEWKPFDGTNTSLVWKLRLTCPPNTTAQNAVFVWWIKSGAKLVANKHYVVGTATWNAKNASNGTLQVLSMPSPYIVHGAQLHVLKITDPKFAQIGHLGWSLTDPAIQHFSTDNNRLQYQPTLDQSYFFKAMNHGGWVGTERATESTLVLAVANAWSQLVAKASQESLDYWYYIRNTASHTQASPGHVLGKIGIGFFRVSQPPTQASTQLAVYWQKPDSHFEVQLLAPTPLPAHTTKVAFAPQVTLDFAPLPTTRSLRHNPQQPQQTLLGNLRFVLVETGWQATLALEPYVSAKPAILEVPLRSDQTNTIVASVVLSLELLMNQGVKEVPPNNGNGLVGLVGLDSLVAGVSEFDAPVANQDSTTLKLANLGRFMTDQYMTQHLNLRTQDTQQFWQRARLYQDNSNNNNTELLPPHQDKTPRAFRPSSSRMDLPLAALPFNVHVASFTMEHHPTTTNNKLPGATFHNVTCGAPADHARGFSNILSNHTQQVVADGGLRRLEAKREELGQMLQKAQQQLMAGVDQYLAANPQQPYIPMTISELQRLRWNVYECVQALHHVTWVCATRRAAVFSQALGIAMTSYLTSLSSDVGKLQSQWPQVWAQHGYLVSFEGLLSAAGKELGMIEDASVAIAMLRRVHIVVANAATATSPVAERVPVRHSPYVQWIVVKAQGSGRQTQYWIQVGVDPSYFVQRIPNCLQGAPVRLYPLLFQVGVDIRQWGAHAGSNMKKNQFGGKDSKQAADSENILGGGLVEDEDDDVGICHNDVLVALNYEAFVKLNAYALHVSPSLDCPSPTLDLNTVFETAASTPQTAVVHSLLVVLEGLIKSSAGKVTLSILEESGTIAQRLGGGGVVFCKSGKDRTAMQVTYKQAQFANRFLQSQQDCEDCTLEDAANLRIYGTRLPICEKNVGQAKFAFNSLQVKFMPPVLRPPMNTLAGFLKGGKIFTGEGIES